MKNGKLSGALSVSWKEVLRAFWNKAGQSTSVVEDFAILGIPTSVIVAENGSGEIGLPLKRKDSFEE